MGQMVSSRAEATTSRLISASGWAPIRPALCVHPVSPCLGCRRPPGSAPARHRSDCGTPRSKTPARGRHSSILSQPPLAARPCRRRGRSGRRPRRLHRYAWARRVIVPARARPESTARSRHACARRCPGRPGCAGVPAWTRTGRTCERLDHGAAATVARDQRDVPAPPASACSTASSSPWPSDAITTAASPASATPPVADLKAERRRQLRGATPPPASRRAPVPPAPAAAARGRSRASRPTGTGWPPSTMPPSAGPSVAGADPQQQRLLGLEHAQRMQAHRRRGAGAADEALDAAVRVHDRGVAWVRAGRPLAAHHRRHHERVRAAVELRGRARQVGLASCRRFRPALHRRPHAGRRAGHVDVAHPSRPSASKIALTIAGGGRRWRLADALGADRVVRRRRDRVAQLESGTSIEVGIR